MGYEKIQSNAERGLHTLCLLDIKVKEIYAPPRFMTVNTALEQFLEVEANKGGGILTEDTRVVAIARVGMENQVIATGTIKELLPLDFGPPLHSLVVSEKPTFSK